MSKKNVSNHVKLRQSAEDFRKQLNSRGDKVINLGNNHAIVKDRHVYGKSAIARAIGKLFS